MYGNIKAVFLRVFRTVKLGFVNRLQLLSGTLLDGGRSRNWVFAPSGWELWPPSTSFVLGISWIVEVFDPSEENDARRTGFSESSWTVPSDGCYGLHLKLPCPNWAFSWTLKPKHPYFSLNYNEKRLSLLSKLRICKKPWRQKYIFYNFESC